MFSSILQIKIRSSPRLKQSPDFPSNSNYSSYVDDKGCLNTNSKTRSSLMKRFTDLATPFERYSGPVVHFARVSSSRRNTDLHPPPSFPSLRDLYKAGRNTAKFRLSSNAWKRIAEVTKGGGRKKGVADGESFLPSIDGRLGPNVTDPPSRGDAARFPRIIILLSYNSSNSWDAHNSRCMYPRLHPMHGEGRGA